jgi:membrane-associated phospholipid phosphatase
VHPIAQKGAGGAHPALWEIYKGRVEATFGLRHWAPGRLAEALGFAFCRAHDPATDGLPRPATAASPTATPQTAFAAETFAAVTIGGVTVPAKPFKAVTFDLDNELAELVALAELRPGVMAEALSQGPAFDSYFMGILSFSRYSHPNTAALVAFAMHAGGMAAMHHKLAFGRPRPSQISPAVMPPVDPPPHASYPSGHATQAHLVALCLSVVMPALVADHKRPPETTGDPVDLKRDPLREMALRIARNREVLGLHYPSDSEAGDRLARRAFATIAAMHDATDDDGNASNPALVALVNGARAEW